MLLLLMDTSILWMGQCTYHIDDVVESITWAVSLLHIPHRRHA